MSPLPGEAAHSQSGDDTTRNTGRPALRRETRTRPRRARRRIGRPTRERCGTSGHTRMAALARGRE